MFLLGVVKYLVQDLMGRMKPTQLRLIEGRYRAFNTTGLNIPSLSPYYMSKHLANFVGKEFKMVLQSAPFVLFGFMGVADRLAWVALCQLAPLVFQSHIEDMANYLKLLRFHIQKFLYYLFKITGQWVNKPKLHMILHLPNSIERFGPALLFATEKFESFNGMLRNASVHSNRQSPGKNIATTFANSKGLRHLVCGGWFKDPRCSKQYIRAAPAVSGLFSQNRLLQQTMDYNSIAHLDEEERFPRPVNSKIAAAVRALVPAALGDHLPGWQLFQLTAIQWSSHRALKCGSFFLASGCY